MFGKWLKEQRLNAGLTQQQLADLLGLTKTSIISYENGNKAGLQAINKISEFFNIEICELRKMMEEK